LQQESGEKCGIKLLHLMGPDLKELLVADILNRYCEQIPYAFVVVWCMKTIAHPVSAVRFGLYYLLRDMTVTPAAFGVAFLWMISPTVNFIAAFTFGLIGGIGYAIRGRDISPDSPQ
jgi:hypothetical protein